MEANKKLNHSASHLLAAAILKLYPNAKLAIGPAIEEGFYYDFEFENPILESDLPNIEKVMKELAKEGYEMRKVGIEQYSFENQPYKKELYEEFKKEGKEITFFQYWNPKTKEILFTDLCAGGHIENSREIKYFKLLGIAGAYWRGDSKNKMLTRIYGTCWETKDELAKYLDILRERKERDHRKIGRDLNLFTFNQLGGQGFPFWLEDGMKIHNAIRDYVLKLDKKFGFREVLTPHFGEKKLYEISGHWAHYQDTMFAPIKMDNETLVARPMTCPHHIILFNSTRRSYKDLPIRYSEQSRLYRYEASGALSGLERVRGMDLTEGHIFVRPDQIRSEFKHLYKMILQALKDFNIEIDHISLSLRDPQDTQKFFQNDEMWNKAENDLREVLGELNIKYKEFIGEAAFYGPKVDFQVKTALNRIITMSTLQLDFLLPSRFEMKFVDSNEQFVTPVLIHRGLIGTYERFIATLLEQTKGVLPFWLSPRQITIIPINDELNEKAQDLYNEFLDEDFNVNIDIRPERINKKIRDAQILKTKFIVVIGKKEIETNTLSVREYGKDDSKTYSKEEFVNYLKQLKKNLK
ncbi:threonine--tRNA ligase [Metamycoplasma hominis]|uniref:Threonine--tRNA ligase n=1 Tax=Metamycoplasma hominis (strain ATCC 23114 / DSM 25592 / NBRC 14850 / NCTC 10111 / PG21) TaxID=347256 RepID=D1J7P2_METH1|nr:threonine--tRNA ligase [Metamycoplasma hominis]MCF1354721.1 threonine--tRNA ligase [Metamycoplasma hominis]OKL23983.1 threonine--tRNA ligase [Metamycoplasma hominis]QKX38173.1 threonine--tRNA ligase [Metamycoplasma hominis]QKX39293.1 threonine--tRNA ligase [Metamycoplasma hominis]QKX39828.1 threonine--tRNA ligase [Metamycoplasma hominis]